MQGAMDRLTQLRTYVGDFISEFDAAFSHSLASDTRWLKQAIDLLNKATGKQVRPLLIGLIAKACGYEPTKKTIEAAVLLELIHTATLIHDDVIDSSGLRRGQATLNAIFDNRVAVLMGDFVLSSAMMRAIELGDVNIMAVISYIGRELSEGEIHQFEVADEIVLDEEVYYSVIKQKTATLFRAAAELAVISVGGDSCQRDKCGRIGELLGYAFQIRDDIFDYYANDVGKPTGNDIREGKITLPLLYALSIPSVKQKYCLDLISKKQFEKENLNLLTQFAIECGGIDYATAKMNDFLGEAATLIDQLPNREAGLQLQSLAKFICDRRV